MTIAYWLECLTVGFLLRGLGVFLAVAVADVAWTRYTLSVTARQRHKAGTWSVVIVLLGAVSFFGYMHDWRLVVFAAGGAYLGTWLAVGRGKE